MLKEVPPVAAGKVQLLLSLNEPQYLLGGKVLIFPEKKIPSFQWLSTISFEKRSWLRAHHRSSVRSGQFPDIFRHLEFAYRLLKTKVSVIT
jgi:hypothetical protein